MNSALRAIIALSLAVWLPLLMLGGCAGRQQQAAVQPAADGSVVIKASSFTFEPNTIVARRGDTLLFVVENTSGSSHNFSVKDPAGKAILSMDLPGKSTQRAKITFTEPGMYEIYCDKPFHSTMGMTGRIEVK